MSGSNRPSTIGMLALIRDTYDEHHGAKRRAAHDPHPGPNDIIKDDGRDGKGRSQKRHQDSRSPRDVDAFVPRVIRADLPDEGRDTQGHGHDQHHDDDSYAGCGFFDRVEREEYEEGRCQDGVVPDRDGPIDRSLFFSIGGCEQAAGFVWGGLAP